VCAFLDIRKAYDTVFRDGVWKRLLEVGIQGKLWRVIRHLYSEVESCVLVGDDLTDWFQIALGLRQGDPLSPILYIVFLDGLIKVLKEAKEGVQIGGEKINNLGFADDLVLVASSKAEMQRLLNIVHVYSRKWRFLFNSDKCKVVIFTSRRVNLDRTLLFLGVDKLQEVDRYTYLGVEFCSNLSWKAMKIRVVKKAKSRLAFIESLNDGISPETSLQLWCTVVRPVMEYAVETWGGTTQWPEAERVQLEFGRLTLGVSLKTAGRFIRGELGLWMMAQRIKLAMLRWWGKLIKMGPDRLAYRIYKTRREQDSRSSWCKSVQRILNDLNVGHLWATEEIGDLKGWCVTAKMWLRDSEQKRWESKVARMPKLRLYRMMKTKFGFEDYLTHIKVVNQRKIFSKFRSGTNELRIETGRWSKERLELRNCLVCGKLELEDERHLLLHCISFEQLRQTMITAISNRTAQRYQLTLMRDNDAWMMDSLLGHGVTELKDRIVFRQEAGKFLYRAMQRRAELIE